MAVSGAPIHPLDHPVWFALTSRQSALAEGGARARRYPPEVAPFAAMVDTAPQSFAALDALMSRSDHAVLFTPDPVNPPAEFKILFAATGEQMIGLPHEAADSAGDIVTLGAADVPAMMALTKLTNPGPFAARTHELGTFLGVRVDGQFGSDGGRADEACPLYRDHGGLRASGSSRPRLRAIPACGRRPPDFGTRRDSVPARVFRERRRHRALSTAAHGNPAPPVCDCVGED